MRRRVVSTDVLEQRINSVAYVVPQRALIRSLSILENARAHRIVAAYLEIVASANHPVKERAFGCASVQSRGGAYEVRVELSDEKDRDGVSRLLLTAVVQAGAR